MRFLLTAIVACSLCLTSVAGAQGDTDRETAVTLGEGALQLYEQKKYAEAYERFEMADRLLHAPTLLLFMARCKRELGEIEQAKALYQRVIDEKLDDDAPPQFFKAQVMANKDLKALEPQPAEPAPTTDGQPAPPAPSAPADEPSEPQAADSGGAGWLAPTIIAFGLGAAGIGAGIATGVMASNEIDDIKSRCVEGHCPPEDEDQAADAHLLADVSTAMFVIGGLGLAAGITLAIWQPGSEASETATLRIGPNGIQLRGRF